jgi:hypothetical protein
MNNKNYINQVVTPVVWEVLGKMGVKHKRYGKYVEKFI